MHAYNYQLFTCLRPNGSQNHSNNSSQQLEPLIYKCPMKKSQNPQTFFKEKGFLQETPCMQDNI